jgi:hypothetical protein
VAGGKIPLANVYIEPRSKSRPEGSEIKDYVVEDRADHSTSTAGLSTSRRR